MLVKKGISILPILSSCLYMTVVVVFPSAYVNNYYRVRWLLCAIIGAYLILHIRTLLTSTYALLNIAVLLFCFSVYVSSRLNTGYVSSYLKSAITYAFSLLVLVFYVEYVYLIGKLNKVISHFYWLTIIWSMITDITAMLGMVSVSDGEGYLIGNKFSVAYLHLFLIALAYYKFVYCKSDHMRSSIEIRFAATSCPPVEIHFIVIYAYCVFGCLYVQCSTAFIGSLLLGVLYIFQKRLITVLRKPCMVMLSIAVFNSILLVNAAIIQWAPIRYVIETLLGKSSDMTGRLPIYLKIGDLIFRSPIYGFGMDNNYLVSSATVGAANVQNGIMDLVVSYGIVGASLFVLFFYLCVRQNRFTEDPAFLMLVYVFIVFSSIEIPFNLRFCFLLMLLSFSGLVRDQVER